MTVAVVTLSREGLVVANEISKELCDVEIFVHEKVTLENDEKVQKFARVCELTETLFANYKRIVYIMPAGVVVRAIAPLVKSKYSDPAVVVCDVHARWCVSLLSGHEGGANELAMQISNAVFAEPIVSTTTEAIKNLIVGIGCRRGTTAEQIRFAIEESLRENGLQLEQVRLLSSAELKKNETGLLIAGEQLGVPIRFISSDEIRNCALRFAESEFVKEKINLPAVAEPCALLAGRRTELLQPKKIFQNVTVAIAREHFLS